MQQSSKSAKSSSAKVIDLLRLESEAIAHAADRLAGTDIQAAFSLIADCSGKVIVTGVGKSGVIAQKIAQTMASTGTMAMFLHPTDALHGGLGVIAPDDVVLALSNSGETTEILTILPSFRKKGISIIAIVGHMNSTLARQAQVVLDASVDKEACPLNLAPTASTTVALAIGDALAMAVMEANGLTDEDFAVNHPAGQLGKRLTLRVSDLMNDSPSISPAANWLDVVKAISNYALGAVNVVDMDGRLLGVVTDGDLRRTIERTRPEDYSSLNAESMMTASPITAKPSTMAFEALRLMEDRPSQISVLPVVDEEGKCVGLLRLHDVVRCGL